MFEIIETRQAKLEQLRENLRPCKEQMELKKSTKAELQAHVDKCIAEYAPTGYFKVHRPFVGSPLAARAGRLG